MDEMNLLQKQISSILSDLLKEHSVDYREVFQKMAETVNFKNAPAYLGFVIPLLSKKKDFSGAEENLNKIIEQLAMLLPENFKRFIPQPISVKEKKVKDVIQETDTKYYLLDEFKKLIFESLIKSSKHQIWNSINILFSSDKDELYQENSSKTLINFLNSCNEDDKLKIIREIVYLSQPKDILKLLQYFEENPNYIEEFFLWLKLLNKEVFDELMKLIYSEKRLYKETIISALPEFEIERVVPFIKDYNWEVTAAAIEKRPELAPKVIQAFHNGELGLTRKFFVDSIGQQDKIFSQFFTELNLTLEEMTELTSKSLFFAKRHFYQINSEDQMIQFCKIFIKKFENEILNLIKDSEERCRARKILDVEMKDQETRIQAESKDIVIDSQEASNIVVDRQEASNTEIDVQAEKKLEPEIHFEIFLKSIIKTCRLTGDLKNYIISKYSDDKRFFHSLIIYLDITDLEKLLEKYYVEDLTLDCLLRKYNTQDLIVEIHKLKNYNFSSFLIEKCIDNPKFEDKDWVLVMKSLEQVDSPIKMNTSMLVIKKRPNLKGPAKIFIQRSITKSIWKYNQIIEDLIKCIRLLGIEGVGVFDAMTKDEIVFVLKRSKEIENNLRAYISKMNESSPAKRFLTMCLNEV